MHAVRKKRTASSRRNESDNARHRGSFLPVAERRPRFADRSSVAGTMRINWAGICDGRARIELMSTRAQRQLALLSWRSLYCWCFRLICERIPADQPSQRKHGTHDSIKITQFLLMEYARESRCQRQVVFADQTPHLID